MKVTKVINESVKKPITLEESTTLTEKVSWLDNLFTKLATEGNSLVVKEATVEEKLSPVERNIGRYKAHYKKYMGLSEDAILTEENLSDNGVQRTSCWFNVEPSKMRDYLVK